MSTLPLSPLTYARIREERDATARVIANAVARGETPFPSLVEEYRVLHNSAAIRLNRPQYVIEDPS